jgi:outer membrane protein
MKTIKLSLLTIALLAATGVQAQKAGDTIISLGGAFISPNASISPTTTTGNAVPITSPQVAGYINSLRVNTNGYLATTTNTSADLFNGKLAGASANIDNASTVSFSVLQMITDNIGAELSLGVPPKLNINLDTPNGTKTNEPNAATARAITPAIVAKYFFMNPSSAYRPYLGLGVTHASFSKVTPDTSNSTVAALAGISASLSSSWAPVYNAGVIYNFDEKWSLNASVSYIPLKTTATFVGPGISAISAGYGNVATTTKLTMNPTDYIIRLGYKF